MKYKTIGIDIDDTIANTNELIVVEADKYDKEVLNGTGIKDPLAYEFTKMMGWEEDGRGIFFNDRLEHIFKNTTPKDNSVEVINKLYDEGYNILFISFRKDKYVNNYDISLKATMLRAETAQSDSSINFAEISSESNGKGLYYTSDLDKTEGGERVYYYRGAVTNNYVQFAGFCWKIVRTNEDGSVKLIYWGSTNGSTCSTNVSIPSSLTKKKFNNSDDDNRYVGYMYGNNCDTYENCHKNENNSIVKGLLDEWYNTNITNEYRSKVADTKYCNDRTIGTPGTIDGFLQFTDDGSGSNSTIFGPSRRLGTGGQTGTTWSSANASPQYNCPNDARDAFTLKVAAGGTAGFGNNALDYPVGLLTLDEVSYAGGAAFYGNITYFLSTGIDDYWTMSPAATVFSKFSLWDFGSRNGSGFIDATYDNNILPVISLNSSALVSTGNGEALTPYVIR